MREAVLSKTVRDDVSAARGHIIAAELRLHVGWEAGARIGHVMFVARSEPRAALRGLVPIPPLTSTPWVPGAFLTARRPDRILARLRGRDVASRASAAAHI